MSDTTTAAAAPKSVSSLKGNIKSVQNKMENLGMLPKIEPVPWPTFIFLLVCVAVPPAGFTFAFSSMGKGIEWIEQHSEERDNMTSLLMMAIAGIMSLLYLLDFSYWTSKLGRFVRVSSLILVAIMMVICILFRARSSPHGLILLYSLGTAAWFIAMKHMFYNDIVFRNYIGWIAGPMFAASLITLSVWIYWVQSDPDNEWDDQMKVRLADKFKWYEELLETDYTDNKLEVCKGTDPEYPLKPCFVYNEETDDWFSDDCQRFCAKIYNGCNVSFFVWSTPLVIAVVLLFFSFICAFLNPQSSGSAPATFGKLFVMLLFGLWCTASLSGAGAGLTESFASFFLGAGVSISMILIATFGSQNVKDMDMLQNLKSKYAWAGDHMKAVLISTSSPIIGMYMCVSFLNQCVRKAGIFPCTLPIDKSKNEHKMWVTKAAHAQIVYFKKWDHSKTYTWAIMWGLAYMIMQVFAAKFTVLFLSWMKKESSSMSFAAVTAIIVGVGMFLFLLPPIPGVPIYLTGGLMLPAVGTGFGTADDGSNGEAQLPGGIVSAVAYTCMVGLILKLCACTLQQKAIGEPLGNRVWIRQLVSINSSTIRTMKLILKQEGLTVAKVAILVGGPDWPTSVLCGIMKLPLHQILLGTLPVFFLIVPTVLAGTFIWMSLLIDPVSQQPIYAWAGTISTLFMVLAASVQSGSMVVAAYHLERAVSTRSDELTDIPIDQEVLDADNRNRARSLLYTQVTQWDQVPYFWKKFLHFGVFAQVVSCYITLGVKYSEPYTLTNTPDDLPGAWYTLLNGMGWLAMAFFFTAFFVWHQFKAWAYRRVDEWEKSGKPMPKVEEDGGEEEAGVVGGESSEEPKQVAMGGGSNKIVPEELIQE
ncbi:hypothetical protein TrST_g10751 [Triparma strigata]|uniref:Uncharacterized protein n=1 Tax=Triparma strigata TaxID=1606541 RepID=A0A9W7EWQ5_9STRA|nr:hypothetical protein TrST_g10751 [Triparma strigata]